MTLDTMRDSATDFVALSRKKLEPFQVKVNDNKLKAALNKLN